jgi:hypothetical protein
MRHHNPCHVSISVSGNLEHSSRNSRVDICNVLKQVLVLNKDHQIIISEVSMNPLSSMKDSEMFTFVIMTNRVDQFYDFKSKAHSFL